VLEAILRAPGFLLTVAAWVTLGFAVVEFAATRRPEKFPTLAGSLSNWTPRRCRLWKRSYSREEAAQLRIGGCRGNLWLSLSGVAVADSPLSVLLMGPGALYLPYSPFQFAPVWVPVFWWVVALNVTQLVWRCVDLIAEHGASSGARADRDKRFCLIPLGMLLAVPDHAYFTLKNLTDQARYGAALDSINLSIKWSALVICALPFCNCSGASGG